MSGPEKAELKSMNVAEDRRWQLAQLFPEVVTETRTEDGKLVHAVDFEKLKAVIGTFSDILLNQKERYGMTWPGKNECLKIIQQPSIASLKPCREESVNFDESENLFIEGDNLEVLKLLQKAYYGKVKMIYIDPPYNTGKEFIYPDNYAETLDTYLAYSGQVDADGRKFSSNTEAEGRYHSNWLRMMYSRLYLARNLLMPEGLIFISIGDDEASNLRKLCDEVFGEENCVGVVTWKARVKPVNIGEAKFRPQKEVEYVYIFQKDFCEGVFQPLLTGGQRTYPHDLDGRKYRLATILKSNRGTNYRSTMVFELDGYTPPDGQRWQAGEDVIRQLKHDGYIEFRDGTPFRRYFEDEEGAEHDPFYCFMEVDWSSTSEAGKHELNELVGDRHGFDTVKPSRLIRTLVQSCTTGKDNELILDFFAGSATTAHAVITENQNNLGNRRFILVQLPEPCDDRSIFSNVAEIGKKRIRAVINGFEKSNLEQIDLNEGKAVDLGFRVFKLTRSNFKVWDSEQAAKAPEGIAKQLELHEQHIDPNARPEDILYELLLKAGFPLTTKVEKVQMAGKDVFSVADGALLICLEREITKELIKAMADADPLQVICLDEGFKANDQLKANAVQTFKARSQGKDKEAGIVFRTV